MNYDLSKLDVLVVEKHNLMRKLERDMLVSAGIRAIRDVGDPDLGFELFKDQPSDLVITDWAPGVDGVRLLKMLRLHPGTPDPYVPVIVVTANTEARHVYEARDAGMTEFLAKPISARLLFLRIKTIIERHRLFVRSRDYFGPDRRRRRDRYPGEERRDHANLSGDDRRRRQEPFFGPERRQGFPGYRPTERRTGARSDSSVQFGA